MRFPTNGFTYSKEKTTMTKKSAESIDYTREYASNGAASPNPAATYQAVQQENQKLRQTIQSLNRKLKETDEQSRLRYEEMLEAVSGLAKKVHSKASRSERVAETNDAGVNDNKSTEKTINGFVKSISDDLCDLDLRFQLHENSTLDGHLIWKINDFENRTNDAIVGKIRALHSAPCFTEKYGYKFCLRLYVHGDGMGRGTHLSLFLVIMKSEYDDILQWPFQKKIKFRLINQKDQSKDHVEQMTPSKDSSSFQKPTKDMNIASGCPLFISLDRLEPEGFLKNGNLFLEVKVE